MIAKSIVPIVWIDCVLSLSWIFFKVECEMRADTLSGALVNATARQIYENLERTTFRGWLERFYVKGFIDEHFNIV